MKKFNQLGLGVLLCIATVLPVVYASSINVDPLRVSFMPAMTGKTADLYQDLKVYNTGNTVAYVQVEVDKVNNPSDPNSTMTPFNGNPATFGLLVSPSKLVIPAEQFRMVRLLRTAQNNKQDLVYKVHVMPIMPAVIPGGNQDQDQNNVQIIVSFDIYTVLLPADPKVKYSLVRNGQTLTVKNEGNTNVFLFDGQQCDAKGANCKALPDNRVYAGGVWTYQLPYSTSVAYGTSAAGEQKTVHSN